MLLQRKRIDDLHILVPNVLVDAVYDSNEFQEMKWKWKVIEPPVHVYNQILWEHNYKYYYEKIFKDFLAPIYTLTLNELPPYMTENAMRDIVYIGDWYLTKQGAYIKVYATNKYPHPLPHYVPKNLVLHEFAYHIVNGLPSFLKR
jgi:hypothetical protein